jgi:hypothetical protein
MVVVKRDSKSSSAVSRSLLDCRASKETGLSLSEKVGWRWLLSLQQLWYVETHISKRLTTSVHKAFGSSSSSSSPGVRPARWVTSINSLSPFRVDKKKWGGGNAMLTQLRIYIYTRSIRSVRLTTPAQRYPPPRILTIERTFISYGYWIYKYIYREEEEEKRQKG